MILCSCAVDAEHGAYLLEPFEDEPVLGILLALA